ncbi:lysophospholipid acyltransferase family protein [Akkermansiaceae bacterium]|nr:lysophospholipid acyltransferase family protein [Akkermansiaceae bacterium]
MKKLVNTADFIRPPLTKKLYKIIQPLADSIFGFNNLSKLYEDVAKGKGLDTKGFCAETMRLLGATYTADQAAIDALKTQSPLLILANHPYGAIDSMAVMHLVCEHFPRKWLLTANQLLKNVDEVADNIAFVDPFAKGEKKKENLKSVKAMHKVLREGNGLMMFPAARVSGWDKEINAVCDLPWTTHPLKLSAKYNVPILLLNISGKNSKKFLAIDHDKIMRRSVRLCKEVFLQKNQTIKINFSTLMSPELAVKISKFENQADILKAHAYLGADRTSPKALPVVKVNEDLQELSTKSPFHDSLIASQSLLCSQSGFASFCFQGKEEPEIMQEIGRLRELTFSSIGAGSGSSVDLSKEDDYYHHIVVTEESTGKIAGAYRVGFTKQILKDKGETGLYLDHIFEIKPSFYKEVGNVLELSRSFIPPAFQKNPKVLDILWKSLGKTAIQNNCDGMYGSVTISNDFTPLSQAILVDTLERYHPAKASLKDAISSSNPFEAKTTYHKLISNAYSEHGIGTLSPVIEDLEDGLRTTPPLIRYYTSLGAKFLSFKVEPTFNNAIYCLLHVDLHQLPERYKKRFLR